MICVRPSNRIVLYIYVLLFVNHTNPICCMLLYAVLTNLTFFSTRLVVQWDRFLVDEDHRHRNGARATRGLAHDRVHVIVQQCRVRPRDRHLQPGRPVRRHRVRLVLHRVARRAHRQAALGRCHCRRYAVETVTTDSSIPSYPSTQLTRHKKNNNYDQLLCDCLKFAMLRDR